MSGQLRGKRFDRPVSIAVEGIDFFHLLRTQFQCDGKDSDLWLYDFFEDREDGRGNIETEVRGTKLHRWLTNFSNLAGEGASFQVQTLAIIRDAEDDAGAEFQRVGSALRAIGIIPPDENGTFSDAFLKGRPLRVGVLIIPHDGESGCLETCLLRAPKITYAEEPSKAFLAEVEAAMRQNETFHQKLSRKTPGGLSRWREKIRVRAMLVANADDPAQKLGPSGSWLWDFDREPLKRMIDFIQEARRQRAS